MDADRAAAWCEKMMSMRRAHVRRALLRHGLHLGQPEMLDFIRTHPGCTQKQMADSAGVTPASIAASFKRMESAGLIARHADTADTRCNRVYITEQGEKVLKSSILEISRLNRQMLEGISQEELAVFCRCMKKMCLNLDQNGEKDDDFISEKQDDLPV